MAAQIVETITIGPGERSARGSGRFANLDVNYSRPSRPGLFVPSPTGPSVSDVPNILFVTHRVPFPPDKGDRIRTFHLLRFLGRVARVHVASLADEPVTNDAIAVLSRSCERVSAVPLGRFHWLRGARSLALGGTISEGVFRSGALAGMIRQWARQMPFHAAIASASSVAHYLRLPELARSIKIVDAVDVDSQKWYDYAERYGAPRSWAYRVEGRRLRKREQAIAKWADAVTLVSDREATMMRDFTGSDKIYSVTNGVDLQYYQPTHGPESGCLFVGALNYPPNVDGLVWFAKTVWPHLRHRTPSATLRVVGRKPVAAVKDLASIPGIEVIGQVPDVRPYLASAAVAIAPLRIARGLQNKVLEAMAAGKPVVASPAALVGFGSPELPARPVSEPAEWVDTLAFLLEHPDQCRRLGLAGRIYAEKYHNWSACLEPFGRLLRLSQPAQIEGAA